MLKNTPINQSTYRFEFDRPISEADFSLENAEIAVNSPLGRKLFGFPWTQELKIFKSAIELTKKDWVDWDILLEPLSGLLEEHIEANTSLEKSPIMVEKNTSGSEAEQIKKFITESINPSLAMHSGWVELKSFENKTAYMSMGGGCQGCASSQATMIDGIENALKQHFSFVERVIDVTDHSSGDNPYYTAP